MIDPLAPAPLVTDSASVFAAKAFARVVSEDLFVTQANALAAAMNLNSTTDTSATSNSIGTGAKTFTVSAGKSFQPGMYLVFADTAAPSTNSMVAQVTSYSGTALVVNSLQASGSGTKTAWNISQSAAPPAQSTGDHIVTVHTGNGKGSTNAAIERFTTTLTNVGSAITYADSATLGASFTINAAGLYEIYYAYASIATTEFGISLNSVELTTNISGVPIARRVAFSQNATANQLIALTRTMSLSNGDVIRPHAKNGDTGVANDKVLFSIRRVGSL